MAWGAGNKTPTLDGSLGLIMRLNVLFSKADYASLRGELDELNHILDRVYVNLSYREPYDVEIKEGKIIKMGLSEDDTIVYNEFNERLKKVAKEKLMSIKNKSRRDFELAKWKHYWILMEKDIWLRKLMNQMGLYMKEVEFNPASALFGG